jgi:hypothetical protein
MGRRLERHLNSVELDLQATRFTSTICVPLRDPANCAFDSRVDRFGRRPLFLVSISRPTLTRSLLIR